MYLLKISLIFFFFLFSLIFAPIIYAAEAKIITPVFPIRGSDFFQLENVAPSTNLEKQWNEIRVRNFSATWLLRPDALNDEEVVGILKSMSKNQEIGIFAEITPTWAKIASVKYHEDQNWHSAGSVFLTGYEVAERQKLIDSAFEKFKSIFGYYPKSVGAWWIDGGSLEYMQKKYGILANMDVSDQYTTDNYQVWGQYFSTPFYPSKRNALIPAQGLDQKIGVVTIQWANRDPFNAYGNGVLDSTYSVQANDYANKGYHNLNIDYFNKLLSIYLDNPYSQIGQVTIGLENDFSWEAFGDEFIEQLDSIKKRQLQGIKILTMSEFSNLYKSIAPNTSPEVAIFADDPLGTSGKVLWIQNPRYRIGWFYDQRGSVIRDLRLFYNASDEPCLVKACPSLNLAMAETKNLDEVNFGDFWLIDEGKINGVNLSKIEDGWKLSYINQAGIGRVLQFLPNDIKVNEDSKPLPIVIGQAIESSRNTPKISQNFNYDLVNSSSVALNQFKNLLIFLIFIILAFYLPGVALLRKLDLDENTKFFLSFPLGISIFTLFSFVFGYLHFWGVIILPILSIFFIRKSFVLPNLRSLRNSLLTTLLIIIGSLTWVLTTIKNGLNFDFGLGFWGPHGHDSLWHLILIESLKSGLPPQNPALSGTILNNYHYFYDLLLAQTSKLSTISPLDLYFRFFPLLISLNIGVLSYFLAKDWFKSKFAANLSVFFVYFGGSFGWLISYFKDRSLGGESLFWAQQAISSLINPPFAISLLLFLAGLILLHRFVYQKQHHAWFIIPLVILWGSMIEFKVYGGVLVLGALIVVSFVEVLKRNFGFLKISIPIAALSLAVFFPNNSGSGSLLIFAPFWLIHSMVDSTDRLNFFRLSLARMAGIESGNWFKFIGAEIVGLIFFLLGNLGTRIISLFNPKFFWPEDVFKLFILSFLILAVCISMLFTQKGAGFNIIQFFYYFIFIFNFFAAFSLTLIIKKYKILGWILTTIVVILTLPTTWDTLHHYLPKRPPAMISQREFEALEFLRKQPEGIVLSYYFDKKLSEKFDAPKPLIAYESTAYVGAFSAKPEFIADTVNLEILGIDYKGRLQSQKDIFANKELEIVKKLLKEGKIKYIYAPKLSGFKPDQEKLGVRNIFENEEVTIFKTEDSF